jgi:predicted nucleotidyltransferase
MKMLEPAIHKTVDRFVDRLKELYGEGLVSVMVYGSAASGEYIERHSDINLLVVLRDASLRNLSKLSPVINSFRFRNLVPIYMTEGYIKGSCDIFPIEYLDMKENSEVLYGKDVLKDITIDLKHLRFQCEQELKSKIVNIKRAYLGRLKSRELEKLLFRSLTSSLHILRNLIRLKGRVPPYAKDKILKVLAAELGLDVTAPQMILNAKNDGRRLTPKEAEDLLFDLVSFLERATEIVDKLEWTK